MLCKYLDDNIAAAVSLLRYDTSHMALSSHSTTNKQSRPLQSVIVIGAGFGGIATAALLAKDGYQVTVLEKNEGPGGRASLLEVDGYRFDRGPSWYLMPEVFERFFAEFETTVEEQVDLVPLAPQYRIVFPDKTQVDIPREVEEVKKIFESYEPGAGEQLERYLADARKKYRLSMDHFLYDNHDSLLDLMNWHMLKFGPANLWRTMDEHVGKYFTNEKLRQILQYTLVFLGGAPSNTPSLYSLMSHVDFDLNVWFPRGGMYSLVESMVAVAEQQGVDFRYEAEVTGLQTRRDLVTGVTLAGGEQLSADVVVGNGNYQHVESLIDDERKRQYSEEYWDERTLAPSALLLYLGVEGSVPEIEHHTILFGEDWVRHFEEIFDRPQWPQQPSLYINRPTATDPSLAPDGYENMMVLVPIAANLTETELFREQYVEYILQYIEEQLDISLRDRIDFMEVFSGKDFQQRYHSLGGSALGLAHTMRQTDIFRPRNHSEKLRNLYFVGADTVPGIGVPMCLISAELVWERVAGK